MAVQAFTILADQHPAIADCSVRHVARTKEDLAFIVRFAAAALLVDDPAVFGDFIQWLQTVFAYRGLPPSMLPAEIIALTPVLSRHDRRTDQLTADALASLTRIAG